MINIAVFASGTGSNFLAIHDAILNNELPCKLSLFVTDKIHSKALQNAKKRSLNTYAFTANDFPSKEAYEKEILHKLQEQNIDLIILAGYMRIIGSTILNSYENNILNIHPSLLPLYKGKDAIGQALLDNATKTGVTVHYVDSGIDTGKIIIQEELEIHQNETRESLESRVHQIEHKLYIKAIKKVIKEMSS